MLLSQSSKAKDTESPDAQGGSAIVEFIFLAVLIMVPVVYLILTVGRVQGGAYAVVGASDQAAKVFVMYPDLQQAQQAAEQAVSMAVEDMGFDPDNAALSITCDGGCFTAGSTVRVSVTLRVELPAVGAIPGVNATVVTVDSSSSQKVGRYK